MPEKSNRNRTVNHYKKMVEKRVCSIAKGKNVSERVVRSVFMVLLMYVDANNQAFPSQELIGAFTACDRRTVRAALRALEEQNIINTDYRRTTGRWPHSVYTITLPGDELLEVTESVISKNGRNDEEEEGEYERWKRLQIASGKTLVGFD